MMNGEIIQTNIDFSSIVSMIEQARNNALRKVNEELVMLYWNVGKYLDENIKLHSWGDKYIDELAKYIAKQEPEIKGFNTRGLYRMRQFYQYYKDDEIVSPLVTQLGWTQHLMIMSHSKTAEERQFYIQLSLKERYSKRELQRQLDSAYYERYMLAPDNLLPAISSGKGKPFLDSYVLDFINLPKPYSEKDLQNALIANIKDFVLEFGKDFSLVGDEYRVQVGKHDYYIDLLFFNRSLSCLVAIELKIGEFKPEYMGKMDLYLEALDRDVRKPNENPSVGIILCAQKDDDVVEYMMSRNISQTLVAKYQTELPSREILQKKLKEIMLIAE